MTPEPPAAARRREIQGGSRLAVLDGMRAVAILAVMAFHYGVRWAPPLSTQSLYPYGDIFTRWPALNYGWAGVELFFVISGYVICMTLERCSGVWDFARRRFARLWPAMVVCATITMGVAVFGPDQWKVGPLSFVSSIFFLDPSLVGRWFGQSGLGWVDGVYWTLWIEVRFYVMAAIVFALFRKRFAPALTIVMLVAFVAGVRQFQYPYRSVAWDVLLPTFLPYFVFGVGVFRLNMQRRFTLTTALVLLLSAVIIFAQGWLSFDYPSGGPWGFALINALIIAAFLLFVAGHPLVAPFGWPPLARLGEASYSLYLIHSVVGIVLIEQLSKVMPWMVALPLVSVAMIALSLALFRWVELPGKTLILQLSGLVRAADGSRLRFSASRRQRRPQAEDLPPTFANG